jgi:DNA-binding transcriptional LysR family regulator
MQWAERIGRRLKLRDLHILMDVIECGSMAKAAERLAVSAPVVSKAIAEMEHVLGVRLLERGPNGIEPTIYGQALFDAGLATFDDLKQGVRKIEALANPTSGNLHIGCSELLAAGLLPAIIERMGRRYPRVVCHLAQTPSASTLEFRELRERRVDLIVGRVAEPFLEEDLEAEHLYDEQLYVVAGRRSKWAKRERIELAELMHEPWLQMPANTLPAMLVEEAFRACGLSSPPPAVVSLSVHLRNALLPTGRYLGIVPGSLLRYGVLRSSVKALPVRLPVKARPVAVVTLKNRTLNPVAKLFIETAGAVAEELGQARPTTGRKKPR